MAGGRGARAGSVGAGEEGAGEAPGGQRGIEGAGRQGRGRRTQASEEPLPASAGSLRYRSGAPVPLEAAPS